MKILITGVEQVLKDERYMDDKGWSFTKAFRKIGIDTEVFFYKKKGKLSFIEKTKFIKEKWHSYMNTRLAQEVIRIKPDVLMVLKGETITASTLWTIRKKTNSIIINVFPDNPLYMGKFESIEPCHYFFLKDSYILNTLKKAGLKNVHYLPQCTDPEVHKPIELNENDKKIYTTSVTLIGSMYPYRLKLMEQLLEFKPSIWGRGWSKAKNTEIVHLYKGRDIRGSQKAKVISGSTISLNPHHPLNDIYGVNRRTFDIAACRGFQVVDYREDMGRLFKINKEIVCFETLEELKKLIEYYLKHTDERDEIAEAAYKRILKEHTYEHRAKEILETIKHI